MADLGTGFRVPFAQQQAALRLRLQNLVPTSAWDDLRGNAHDSAFVVAGATKADLLADLAAAVEKAVSQGTTLDQFRKDFRAIVARHGWTGWTGEGSVKGEAWRTRVIYQTNILTSYAAGRMAQLIDGNFKFWVYRHSGAEHPRLHHLAWDGLALPPDHPFWLTHAPPNGWGCGCRIQGARTAAGIRRAGGDPDKALPPGWQALDPRTGAPKGIDKGWAHAPGATVADKIVTLKDKLPSLPAEIGARMFADWPAVKVDALAKDFAAFVDTALSSYVQKNAMIVGALKPAWVKAAIELGVRPASAEIAVLDSDVHHAFRGLPVVTAPKTKSNTVQPKQAPLDLEWYKQLPRHLQSPKAVILDRTMQEPVFFLIFDVPDARAKLVIEIDTWMKKEQRQMNTVRSGRLISLADLRADLGRGLILIEGTL